MYTFTYSVVLPANMSADDRLAFFNAVNSAIDPVVQAAADQYNFNFESSTYVVDQDNTPVC
jgi:hypothetical protein